MKRKIAIVAGIMWLTALLGGGLWGVLERRFFASKMPAGILEIKEIRDLYSARLFDEALAECDRAESDRRYAEYLPQIQYIRWVINRRLERMEESSRIQSLFLERFPKHVLAADMHFANVMSLLAASNYQGAEKELALIEQDYSSAGVAPKARSILELLRRAPTTAPTVR